jgi:hypothetical protein
VSALIDLVAIDEAHCTSMWGHGKQAALGRSSETLGFFFSWPWPMKSPSREHRNFRRLLPSILFHDPFSAKGGTMTIVRKVVGWHEREKTRELVDSLPFPLHLYFFVSSFMSLICFLFFGGVAVVAVAVVGRPRQDFRPEYQQLSKVRAALPSVPFMALTATAAPRVRSDVMSTLALRRDRLHVAASSFDRPNLAIQGQAAHRARVRPCPDGQPMRQRTTFAFWDEEAKCGSLASPSPAELGLRWLLPGRSNRADQMPLRFR